MSRLLFDADHQASGFTVVLSTRSYEHLGALGNVDTDSISYTANLNSADELSFKIYKTLDGRTEPLWNETIDLKLIWVPELDEYFEIHINTQDSSDTVKSITATSLCEAELGQTILYNVEINTENDIARDDYVITKFYDPEHPEGSLLHRIISKTPHYHLKSVDASLKDLQRSFHIDGTSVYDFLTGECAEQFHCLFTFDSTDRGISVYDLSDFGEDTAVYIDKENLTDSVTFETDADSVKNCFKLEAGDALMTATVRALNPNGSDYLYYMSAEQKSDLPAKLTERLDSYDLLYDSYTDEYQALMEDLYKTIDEILYYTSEMMPAAEHAKITASTEAAKLTAANLSPLGLSSVTTSTSVATVNSALKNFAKVYVKTGYVKLEINENAFQYVGKDSNGYSYGMWKGNFKVTNYSDEDDVAVSDTISIKVYDNYQDFIEQKIKKAIAGDNDEDGSVYDVLSIEDLNAFKAALKLYCLHRLTSFYDAIQGALDVLIEEDQSSENADLYQALYLPYYNKLQACQHEIDVRQKTIDEWQHTYDGLEARKKEIQSELNFENYLGEELYRIFCSYRREEKYTNSNYTSDGLNNSELFARAVEFLDAAKEELYRSGEYQHTISTTLHNLLLMPEFEPILDKFEPGNWIRIGMDGDVYRLRLTGYTVNFSDVQTLGVTFSDVTKVRDEVSDMESILSSAKSMATNYGYVSNQASNGQKAQTVFESFREEGLNSALYKIKNAETEDIVFDKHGLLCRSYDDISDSYGDEQFKLTHNILAFTDDNWKTTRAALGKMQITRGGKTEERYGLNADFVLAGYIEGTDIIGGNISGTNITGTNISGTNISGTNISGGTISGAVMNNGNGTFSVDQNGKMTANSASIDGTIKAGSGSSFGVWNITNDCIYRNSPTYGSTNGMYFGTDGLSIGNSFKVSSNGTLNASNATVSGTITTSHLTADGGSIGGASISPLGMSFNSGDTGWGLWGTTDHAGIVFHAGGNTAHIGSAPFRIYHDGSFVATNADITGTINATSGSFRGTIYATGGSFSGEVNATSGSFSGEVNATSGSFSGEVNATSGTFHDVNITESCKVAGKSIEGTVSASVSNTNNNSMGTLSVTSLRSNVDIHAGGGEIGTMLNPFGHIYANSFVGSFSESSSRSIKTNIQDVSNTYCLNNVLTTEVKTYNYKTDVIDVSNIIQAIEQEKAEYLASLDPSEQEEENAVLQNYDIRIENAKKNALKTPKIRYGFIAEDAPEDIVAKDRKSVDLYSCVAMAYGAIQALNEKVNNLMDKKGE